VLEGVVGLVAEHEGRIAALDAASELMAAPIGTQLISGSGLYRTPSGSYVAAIRIRLNDHNLDRCLSRIVTVERSLSTGGRPRAVRMELLWGWRHPTPAEPAAVLRHPELWWRPAALAALMDVAPELRQELHLPLGWAGGAPQRRPWPTLGVRDVESTTYADAADAVAGAALWRASQLGLPEQRPSGARDWDPTPVDGRLDRALAQIDEAFGTGFRVRAAAVLDCSGPRWKGRLFGVHAPAVAPRPATSLRVAELAAGGFGLRPAETGETAGERAPR